MKMLTQRAAIGEALPFNLDDVKEHIRIDHEDDDASIIIIGKTAAAEIEQFAQIALLTQTVRITIFGPPLAAGLSLPIGPVSDTDMPTITIDGLAFTGFDFVGGMRPYIRWLPAYQAMTPNRIDVEYQAGFGAAASDIPADLAQALMDQAALHYDGRSPMDAKSLTTSPHMARIGARYRGVQA